MCHRQVDIGDPLLARYVREVEGEDEVDVVGSPAHHEDRHHHSEHLHLVMNNSCGLFFQERCALCYVNFPLKWDSIESV